MNSQKGAIPLPGHGWRDLVQRTVSLNAGGFQRQTFTKPASGGGNEKKQQVNPHCGCRQHVVANFTNRSQTDNNDKMKKQNLIVFMILMTFFSCNQTKNQTKSDNSLGQADTIKRIENQKNSETSSEMECVRGAAEPIIKKSVFPNADFKLQLDKITGIETVEFDNNDRLTIKNWGCESYCLTFRFETTRFQEDTTNLQFWYKKAVLLMSEIVNGLDSPINIDKGTKELINFIEKDQSNNYANLKLQKEIDFGGEEIRDYVTVERIQKINDSKYAIEISYVTGPL